MKLAWVPGRDSFGLDQFDHGRGDVTAMMVGL